MLFRAIAPLSMVQELIANCVPGQGPYLQGKLMERMVYPDRRDALTARVSSHMFDELTLKTQATPHPILRVGDDYTLFQNDDALWLSDHDGKDVCMFDSTFDIFFHIEE